MAKETFTGPLIALGGLAGGISGSQPKEYSDEIGPSVFWAGMAIPATGAVASKDRTGPGSIPAVYLASPIRTVNAIMAASNAALTVAGAPTAGTPLVNISTYAAGRAPGTPVSVGGVPTIGVAIDGGLDTATFATSGGVPTGGLATLAAPSVAGNVWRYRVGQWVCLLNGGAGGASLMSQITAINSTTGVLTLVPAPVAAVTGQITLTNRYNPNAYGAVGPPSGISSMAAAGSARIVIPELGNSRGIGILGVAACTGNTFAIVGLGTFGTIQTETIVHPGGAVTVWSKKTYDMLVTATPLLTEVAGHNYTVVTGDIVGLPMSVMDASSIVSVSLGGVAAVAGTNFIVIPADLTNPATALTGDARGGIQVGAAGPAATTPGTPMAAFNGTLVLSVDQRLNPLQVALASTINPGPLLGVATV